MKKVNDMNVRTQGQSPDSVERAKGKAQRDYAIILNSRGEPKSAEKKKGKT